MVYKVGYIVGSLSKVSINRKLANALVKLAPAELEMVEIPIKDLPLYTHDYDPAYPPAGQAFKEALEGVDAVLFITPEYNRSVPAALKNALEWASRPWGKNSFAGKPTAVTGTSPGAMGASAAQIMLKSILNALNSPQLTAPEAFIHSTPGLIADDGEISVESTRAFLAGFMNAFHKHIVKVKD